MNHKLLKWCTRLDQWVSLGDVSSEEEGKLIIARLLRTDRSRKAENFRIDKS